MLPNDLKAEQFASYPPQARVLIVGHLDALQQLPVSFVPSLLREAIDYDYKFPAERSALDAELAFLSSLSRSQVSENFRAFAQLSLSPKLEQFDWINQPARFVEQLSAYLWTTQQLDAFRKAATEYGDRLRSAAPPPPIAIRRLGIAVIGQGVTSYEASLFRNLRPHGAYFATVKPEMGLSLLLIAVEARAKAYPVAYGHWYIDGGSPANHSSLLTSVAYQSLAPVRTALLDRIQSQVQKPGMGPEELSTHLAALVPADLGMDKAGDPILDRFQVRLFTEGSGTQIFSTTFAQWTAREALRRAQPLTTLVRFAPRQRQRPMNELLSSDRISADLDPVGSLVDADMGAYYTWLNQQRLPGADQSAFLVWFEGHNQAIAIGPSIPKGTVSTTVADLGELASLVVA